jgi:hypothetical protein
MKCDLLLDGNVGVYWRLHEFTLAPALQTLELIHGAVQLALDVRLVAHNTVCTFRAGDIWSKLSTCSEHKR